MYPRRFSQINTHFSAFFEIYSRPYRAKKKCEHFSSPEKKEHLAESPRLGRPSRRPWALWGLPTLYVRVTFGLRWAYVRPTLGLPSVMSLAIPGRFWVILAESPVKRRDRRGVFYEMIDFPIRKRHFLVWWSVGGPWEPPGRKKRWNQMFLQIPHSSRELNFKFSKKKFEILPNVLSKISKFLKI